MMTSRLGEGLLLVPGTGKARRPVFFWSPNDTGSEKTADGRAKFPCHDVVTGIASARSGGPAHEHRNIHVKTFCLGRRLWSSGDSAARSGRADWKRLAASGDSL